MSEPDIQLKNVVSATQSSSSNTSPEPEELPSPQFIIPSAIGNEKPKVYHRASSMADADHGNGCRNYASFSSLGHISSITAADNIGNDVPMRGRNTWISSKQGATLVWRDVCVYATNGGSKATSKNLRRIINNSTGAIQPGTLMAVMGSRWLVDVSILLFKFFQGYDPWLKYLHAPLELSFLPNHLIPILVYPYIPYISGAGKSTLMSALACRNASGTIVQGDILCNGRRVGPFMHRMSGFVHQDDLFHTTLTVYEHLSFMVSVNDISPRNVLACPIEI